MCLIVFAWKVVPGIPLLAAANRDEFYERPAAPAAWWEDQAHIYAGRDLQGGGTWMGVTREGRFAAITNIRAPSERKEVAPSRGEIVAGYLSGIASPQQFVDDLAPRAGQYNGFNLLVGNREELVWYSNGSPDDERNGKPLPPGVYGLSNGSLDSPWPKVVRTKAQFSSLLCQGAPEDAYFEMLSDTSQAPDCRLPRTGVSMEWERILSAVCIDSPGYGTRSSTVVRLPGSGAPILHERLVR
ncbi:MAG TPA: NRDE family protein [Noviherbaspirillum sp.]|nr:NRDE family protein [Noviherbaspirillum sp.]